MNSFFFFSRLPVIPVLLAASLALGIVAPPARATELHGFGPASSSAPYFYGLKQIDRVGDFNNDGLDDIVSFWRSSYSGSRNGDTYVRLNNGNGGFSTGQKWHEFFSIDAEIPLVGDFNGDGRDDIVTFLRGTSGDVYVATSNGQAFGTGILWHAAFCIGSEIPVVADINGDGRDDILTFTRGTDKRVFAALSTGTGFAGTGALWHGNFCPGEALPFAGDVNGDGKDDIIACYRSSQTGSAQGDVMVALSTGSGFGPAQKWHDSFALGNETPLVGDIDADGRADLVNCNSGANGDVYVALSTGTNFEGTGEPWLEDFASASEILEIFTIGRFNPDLNHDLLAISVSYHPFVFPPEPPTAIYRVTLAGGHESDGAPRRGPFIPFLSAPFNPTVRAGQSIALEGNLGTRSLGQLIPVLADEQGDLTFLFGPWTESHAELMVPAEMRPGKYRLAIYEDFDLALMSNTLPITIENPYWPWADVALQDILETHPRLAGPFEDADNDGWPNIGEYLVDSDPLDGSSHPDLSLQVDQEQNASFLWTERRDRAEFVRAQPQRSTDLLQWQNLSRAGVASNSQTATYAVQAGGQARQFLRLKFNLVPLP